MIRLTYARWTRWKLHLLTPCNAVVVGICCALCLRYLICHRVRHNAMVTISSEPALALQPSFGFVLLALVFIVVACVSLISLCSDNELYSLTALQITVHFTSLIGHTIPHSFGIWYPLASACNRRVQGAARGGPLTLEMPCAQAPLVYAPHRESMPQTVWHRVPSPVCGGGSGRRQRVQLHSAGCARVALLLCLHVETTAPVNSSASLL